MSKEKYSKSIKRRRKINLNAMEKYNQIASKRYASKSRYQLMKESTQVQVRRKRVVHSYTPKRREKLTNSNYFKLPTTKENKIFDYNGRKRSRTNTEKQYSFTPKNLNLRSSYKKSPIHRRNLRMKRKITNNNLTTLQDSNSKIIKGRRQNYSLNAKNAKTIFETNYSKIEEVTPLTRASNNYDTPKESEFEDETKKPSFFSIKKKRLKNKKKTFNEMATEVSKRQNSNEILKKNEISNEKFYQNRLKKKILKKVEKKKSMKMKKETTPIKRPEDIKYFKSLFKNFNPIRPLSSKHIKLKDYLSECLTVIEYFESELIQPPRKDQIDQKSKILIRRECDKDKKFTLVFDLDETLIHCVENHLQGYDFSIDIMNSMTKQMTKTYFNIRPHLIKSLEALSKKYELIMFTASQPHYANKVLSYIDPQDKYFAHRLYRQDCIELQPNLFTKDLRIIRNRDLKNMVLIDNALYSYYFTPEQGMPILPFTDNKKDTQLLKLAAFLLRVPENISLSEFTANYLLQHKVKSCRNLRDFINLYLKKF